MNIKQQILGVVMVTHHANHLPPYSRTSLYSTEPQMIRTTHVTLHLHMNTNQVHFVFQNLPITVSVKKRSNNDFNKTKPQLDIDWTIWYFTPNKGNNITYAIAGVFLLSSFMNQGHATLLSCASGPAHSLSV